MAVTIGLEEVGEYLNTETRRAIAAATRIPINAAKKTMKWLIDNSPVYSGAYRACLAIGIDELPSIDVTVATPDRFAFSDAWNLRGGSSLLTDISDVDRHFIAAHGPLLEPGGPWQDVKFLDRDFEAGDEIVIGNEIRYAQLVEEKEGFLITARAFQIMEVAVQKGIDDFNRRSDAATIGTGGDIVE